MSLIKHPKPTDVYEIKLNFVYLVTRCPCHAFSFSILYVTWSGHIGHKIKIKHKLESR
jgi:hypothetical protein